MLIYCIKNREGIARYLVQNHFHSADIGFRQKMIALAMEKTKSYNLNLANVFFKSGMIEAWGRGFDKRWKQPVISSSRSLPTMFVNTAEKETPINI